METAGEGETGAEFEPSEIEYVSYGGEHHLPLIMRLVDQELSEPYSIFTYRYFVYLWPHLSFLAFHRGICVGTVVCKMGEHRSTFRGYIAMLVVIKPYRGKGIGDIGYRGGKGSKGINSNISGYTMKEMSNEMLQYSDGLEIEN